METKICTKCNIEKHIEEFRWRNKNKGWRTCWCKPCYSKHEQKKWIERTPEQRNRRIENRRLLILEKKRYVWNYFESHPCVICGESDPVVLEFDHINPKNKTSNISDMITSTKNLRKVQDEINKCQVLCANCHRRKTAKDRNWYKFLNE